MFSSSRKKPEVIILPVIETTRLFLRPAVPEDYLVWRSVRAANYDYLKPFEPAWPASCLEEEFFQRRVKRLNEDWANDRTFSFLIFGQDVQAPRLIGGININNVTRGAAQFGSLGYWLSEDAQGKGYMTEAAQAVLEYGFFKRGLERMNAATLPHNKKSMAMLLRLGFVEEGFAKAYVQIDGARADHALFGLTAEDFRKSTEI